MSYLKSIWKSMKYFMEYYDLKPTFAYELVNREDFPMKRVGAKKIIVDMSKTDEYFDKHFNYKKF